MGRPRSPHGYEISRYNRLSHGVEHRGVMPSRGSDKCFHAERCPVAEDDRLRPLCRAGELCPYERWIYDRYVESARSIFSFCRKWLPEEEFEETISQLGIVELQRSRLSGLVARQGFTRPKVHPVSGIRYGIEEAVGAGRYATALDARLSALMAKVLTDPSDEDPKRQSN